jgi:hypothetical protein
MKKLLLTTATLMALANPVAAGSLWVGVGGTISFNTPRPIAVGCTSSKDAVQIAKLHRQRDQFGIQEFVDWIENGTNKDRICIVLNSSPNNKWTIVKKDPTSSSGGNWVCLQAEYDFRPESEQNAPAPCLWIYLP